MAPHDFEMFPGTHKTLVPKATAKDGSTVGFPIGSVFLWEILNTDIVSLSDPNAASPELTAADVPSDPDTAIILQLTVTENGFVHTKTHTLIVLDNAPEDALADVDFDLV